MIRKSIILKAFFIGFALFLSCQQTRSVSAGTGIWTTNGPDGGTIRALAVDPASPDTVYAGTWGGGVYKSTNGGSAWAPANGGLDVPWVLALAVDPATPDTLFAGSGWGIYKSTDGGGNWNPLSIGIFRPNITSLAMKNIIP